jgi:hypothetical protein
MPRTVKKISSRSDFDQFAGIHDADPLADPSNNTEIVGDIYNRHTKCLPYLKQEVKNCSLDCDIESGGWLIEHKEVRFRKQRHGNNDALLLPTAQFVRVSFHDASCIGEMNAREHFDASLIGSLLGDRCVDVQDLGKLCANPHCWRERRGGILVYHSDLGTTQPSNLM